MTTEVLDLAAIVRSELRNNMGDVKSSTLSSLGLDIVAYSLPSCKALFRSTSFLISVVLSFGRNKNMMSVSVGIPRVTTALEAKSTTVSSIVSFHCRAFHERFVIIVSMASIVRGWPPDSRANLVDTSFKPGPLMKDCSNAKDALNVSKGRGTFLMLCPEFDSRSKGSKVSPVKKHSNSMSPSIKLHKSETTFFSSSLLPTSSQAIKTFG
mmetsp:Transcript_14331/g.19610  ORF Transcript_14331/g.19610 Transcript_14331/m.19610 type:complete len:210 (-) Transcript_14331:713-1342(-)